MHDNSSNKNIKKLLFRLKNRTAAVCIISAVTLTALTVAGVNFSGTATEYTAETMAAIENEAKIEKANELPTSAASIKADELIAAESADPTVLDSKAAEGAAVAAFNMTTGINGGNAEKAVGLFIDGNFIGAAADANRVKALIEDKRAKICEAQGADSAEYTNVIRYSSGIYPNFSVYSEDELALLAADALDIMTVKTETTVNTVPYKVIYEENEDEYEGYERTVQNGSDGSESVTVRYKYLNGELTSSETVSVKTVTPAVNEIITVGTKPIPDKGVGSGSLIWPVPYTTDISSEFGSRWGRLHKGIDISARGCYGEDIIAADGGVVTWSGYDNSGYGYHIIIDHGNGMQTHYAHCSNLFVSEGEAVGKGQTIGTIGCSGNVTGEHLHFEVIINGSYQNPRNYL